MKNQEDVKRFDRERLVGEAREVADDEVGEAIEGRGVGLVAVYDVLDDPEVVAPVGEDVDGVWEGDDDIHE